MDIYPSGIKVPNEPQKGFGKPVANKGYTVGTFGVTVDKKPVPKEMISFVPTVGREVRNPEMEEDIRQGKLARKEGFHFETDAQGNVTEAHIPNNYLEEEKELREKLERKVGETIVLKKVIKLSGEFTASDKEVELLKPKLQNPSTIAVLETVSSEIKKLIDDIQRTPENIKVDELVEKLEEFKKIVDRAKDEVAKIPVAPESQIKNEEPVVVPPEESASTVPEASPKTPEKIELVPKFFKVGQRFLLPKDHTSDEATWEVTILIPKDGAMMMKQIDGAQKGRAERFYFNTFKDFLEKLYHARRQAATKEASEKPVVETSVQPVAALQPTSPVAPKSPEPLYEYGGWPTSEIFHRKQAKNVLGGWYARGVKGEEYLDEQEVWENESKAFEISYKRYIDFIKNMRAADKQLVKPLIDAKNAVIQAVKNRDTVLVSSLRELFEISLEEWMAKWSTLEKIRSLEKTVFESDKKASEKIEESLTSEEEKRGLSQKRKEIVESIEKAKTASLAEGFSDDSYDGLARLITKHHDSVEIYKNKQKSLGVLRPIKVTEKNKGQTIRLIGGKTSTLEEWGKEEKVRLQSEKTEKENTETLNRTEVRAKFEEMFVHDKGAFISLYTAASKNGTDDTTIYTENETLRKHPYRDVIRQVFFANNIKLTGLTREEITKKDDVQKEGEQLARTALGSVYSPARDSAQAAGRTGIFSKPKEITSVGGMIQNSKTVLKEAAVENPLREAILGVEKNTEKNPQEKLKRIASVLSTRIKNLSNNPNNLLKGKLSWIAFAVAVGGASVLTAGHMKSPQEKGPMLVSESLDKNEFEIKDTWRKYYHFGKTHPDFAKVPEDISKLSVNQLKETLIQKYAKSYFDGTNNPRQTLLALGMFGDLVRDDVTKGTYDHLPEKGRAELSYLWDALNDVSMATSGEKLQAKTYEAAIEEVKQKVTNKEA